MIWVLVIMGVLVIIALVAVLAWRASTRSAVRKIDFMSDAIACGERNFKYRETHHRTLNHSLNRLKQVFDSGKSGEEDQSYTKLIRVLTHEIANTLTPISSLSTALSRDIESYSEEDLKTALHTIASSAEPMLQFTRSYRELTLIAKPVMRSFALKELAEGVLAGFANEALELSYEESPGGVRILADRGQISQVLVNLVKNAVEADARRIEIVAQIDRRDRVLVSVTNDGEAISEGDREQIFIPFYTTKGETGSGIGLSLSRQIARQNGATLFLSESGEGRTTFLLVF